MTKNCVSLFFCQANLAQTNEVPVLEEDLFLKKREVFFLLSMSFDLSDSS